MSNEHNYKDLAILDYLHEFIAGDITRAELQQHIIRIKAEPNDILSAVGIVYEQLKQMRTELWDRGDRLEQIVKEYDK